MKPEQKSKSLLGVTRSKAKMYEYGIPKEHHIDVVRDPARLFSLAIGMLGDIAVQINTTEHSSPKILEMQKDMRFVAYFFFDAYFQTQSATEVDPYLLLLGSSAYYLCNLPGSSKVLVEKLENNNFDLSCSGVEYLLAWLLKGNFSEVLNIDSKLYGEIIKKISHMVINYYKEGKGEENLVEELVIFRKWTYSIGSSRQLLFVDLICAIIRKRRDNSTWHCLPQYSDISVKDWTQILQKKTFIQEFWPAQHLLGECDVFKGASAVIQMPTSAGKTKATEIIIRSAFLSNRATLAVIVAPFRALCHEISHSLMDAFQGEKVNVDEISDVLQTDFEIDVFLASKQVLVVTPEKLIYMLRNIPELGRNIGLLIYDEGHQFDSGTRGVTYELLLTSLKMMVPDTIQTVLISAVISNAEAINDWLNGKNSKVISGANLDPTYRTLAFASLQDLYGRDLLLGWLKFVNPQNADEFEFFVPRVIEEYELKNRTKKFPIRDEKDNGKEISLYLGLRVASSGSVAIFCGRKDTATGLSEKALDVYKRGLPIAMPIEFSNKEEISRLNYLYEHNLGKNAVATENVKLGIFTHHGNIPHGIRLAVEYAMKESLIRFVICTSTLAQGVNLPIRYLIVGSVYQGVEPIKVRDFHNLIGRVGRSGMHTEGSILFADPKIYDNRTASRENWRWFQVKNMLEPNNSEPCVSTLLRIFEPFFSDNKDEYIEMDPLDFVKIYIEDPLKLEIFPTEISEKYPVFTKIGLKIQIKQKIEIIDAIESYLMAHWDNFELDSEEDTVEKLAQGTLAYYLADEKKKNNILKLFKLLIANIQSSVPDIDKRRSFGKTLYGVQDSLVFENWVNQHVEDIEGCQTHEAMLDLIWPLVIENIKNPIFNNVRPKDILIDVAKGWIQGQPFHHLFSIFTFSEARIGEGKRPRYPKIEHVVDICENILSFEATLIIGAVIEFSKSFHKMDEDIISGWEMLQKRLKYGLNSPWAVILFELGFADRVVATEIASVIGIALTRKDVVKNLQDFEIQIRKILDKYPAYFLNRFEDLLKAG